jgi:hypothetical protein
MRPRRCGRWGGGCLSADVYGPCITCDFAKDGSKSKRSNSRIPVKSSSLLSHLLRGPDACIDACDATNWLSQPSVVQALHVSPNIDWTICSENGTFNYESTIADLRTTVYPALTQQAGYRVLIFNGEADACVPYTDNGTLSGLRAPWQPLCSSSHCATLAHR